MIFDGLTLAEGSVITNTTVSSGLNYPSSPNVGELFFKTDVGLLFVHNGTTWVDITSAGGLVDSVAGKTGVVTLVKADVGLGNVDNTSDVNKPLSTAQSAAMIAADDVVLDQATTLANNAYDNAVAVAASDATTKANNAQAAAIDAAANAAAPIAHVTDDTVHLTSTQNNLLDNLTPTVTELNYVDGVTSAIQDQLDDKVAKAGSTMTGHLVMTTGTKITIPDAPVAGTDAANKNYVDSASAGLSWKDAVKLTTTANITLSGTQTIDGVAAAVSDRILVKNQTATEDNGIYVVASGAWSRSTDMDQTTPVNEINSAAVFVLEGTTNGGSGWTQTNSVATLGTDPIVFTQFNGASVINAGVGLLKTGNQLDINLGAGISQLPSDEVGIDVYTGGGLMTTVDGTLSSTLTNAQLSLTRVGTAGTYRSVTTDAYGRITAGTNPTTLAGYGISLDNLQVVLTGANSCFFGGSTTSSEQFWLNGNSTGSGTTGYYGEKITPHLTSTGGGNLAYYYGAFFGPILQSPRPITNTVCAIAARVDANSSQTNTVYSTACIWVPATDGSGSYTSTTGIPTNWDQIRVDDVYFASSGPARQTAINLNMTTTGSGTKYNIYGAGNAPSVLAGNLTIGSTTAPTGKLDIVGTNGTITYATTGDSIDFSYAGYNRIRTVGASAQLDLASAGTGGIVTLSTVGSERFRVGAAGQLGVAGANYGTAGQVLVSGGASAAPSWTDASGSGAAVGGGSDQVFFENDQTVSVNYTITAGKNALSAGPVSIANGVTVTIPTGATWSIV